MPFCPSCGYEYEAGITRCPDCQVELEASLPDACPRCEEPVGDDDIFCPHCGVLMVEVEGERGQECAVHAKVPAIAACVVCGKRMCDRCAREKEGKYFCDNDEHVKMAFDWAQVYTAATEIEAEMVKANLAGAGISAVVLLQTDRMYVATLGDLAVARVMVPKYKLSDAEEIIRAMEQEEGEDAEEPTTPPSP